MKTALITGITGQDGSYLTEQLLEKGYTVHGMIRRASSFNTGRIDHLFSDPNISGSRLFLHHGDLTDSSNLNRILEKVALDEIYNLGAQSHVKVSFEVPEYTAEVDAIGTLRFLDAIKEVGLKEKNSLLSSFDETNSTASSKLVPQTEKTWSPSGSYIDRCGAGRERRVALAARTGHGSFRQARSGTRWNRAGRRDRGGAGGAGGCARIGREQPRPRSGGKREQADQRTVQRADGRRRCAVRGRNCIGARRTPMSCSQPRPLPACRWLQARARSSRRRAC